MTTTYPYRPLAVAAVAVAALLAASCSGGDDTAIPAEGSDVTSTTTSAPTPETPAADSSGRSWVEGSVAADLEQIHANGVAVSVTGVAAQDNAVYVDLEAFNPMDIDVTLVPNPNTTFILVGGQHTLAVRPPVGNPNLEIPPAGELTARLAFVGRIPGSEDEVQLFFNWRDGEPLRLDEPRTDFPSFDFELPNPGSGS